MRSCRKAKKQRLTTKDLDYGGSASPIYVNEHLTGANKKLLGAAIAQKKLVGWKFVWSPGGKVFARKDEHANAIRIAGMFDVGKIVN